MKHTLSADPCRRWLVLPVLGLLFAGVCLAQNVQTEFDQSKDFRSYKTFSIDSGSRVTSASPALNNELVKQQLTAQIQAALQAKGLVMVKRAQAQLHVRYSLGTPRGVETEAYPAGWRGWGTRIVKIPVSEGTLVIDLRDANTRTLVWRSIARDDQQDPNKIASHLNKMVQKSFKQYPPKIKK